MVRDETQLSRGAFFYLAPLSHNSITDLALKRQSLGPTDAETCPLGLCLINQIDLEAGVFAFPAPERDNPKMTTATNAMKFVERAIESGELVRPDQCQTCTKRPTDNKTRSIVAHHWNGYDDPLNVWWVCRSCNGLLDVHDGSLNLEQAKLYVRKRQLTKLFRIK